MNTKIYVLTTLAACIGLLLTGFSAGAVETRRTLSFSGVIQQTSGTYTYIITVLGSNYQLKDGSTGELISQSTDATQLINTAFGNLNQGNSILFSSGTYNLNGTIWANGINNVTLTFENGATLFVANGMDASAMVLYNCDNWLISGVTINGNAANQAASNGNGICINVGSNCRVDGANIYNCRNFGFFVVDNPLGTSIHDGVTNSKFTSCGWNGITLGIDVINCYAINNTVAYCSDVGITSYGIGNLIQGNYIHDIYGTTGYANSGWGIGVEGGHGHTITGNTLVNCPRAMSIEQTDGLGSNTITGNNITTCGFGMVVVSPNNTITHNTISDFDMNGWGQQAIVIDGNYGGANYNKVLNNTISRTNGVAHAVIINSADDTQFTDNRIDVPRIGTSWYSIQISRSSRTQILRNTIIGFMGIIIGDAACQSTTIAYNDLTQCNAETGAIADYGTGTIIYGNFF